MLLCRCSIWFVSTVTGSHHAVGTWNASRDMWGHRWSTPCIPRRHRVADASSRAPWEADGIAAHSSDWRVLARYSFAHAPTSHPLTTYRPTHRHAPPPIAPSPTTVLPRRFAQISQKRIYHAPPIHFCSGVRYVSTLHALRWLTAVDKSCCCWLLPPPATVQYCCSFVLQAGTMPCQIELILLCVLINLQNTRRFEGCFSDWFILFFKFCLFVFVMPPIVTQLLHSTFRHSYNAHMLSLALTPRLFPDSFQVTPPL